MGIFDFFRKKKNNPIEDTLDFVMKQAFPNGKKQAIELSEELYKYFNGRYTKVSLLGTIGYCASLFVTSKDKSATRIVENGILRKPNNVYTESDAKAIYMAFVRSHFESKIGINAPGAFDAFLKSLGNIDDKGEVVNKRFKNAYGKYGVSLSNPVPIKGVPSAYTFLNNLLTAKGEAIKYERVGSFSSDVTSEIVDGYDITSISGISLGTIYICSYCNVIDPDAPEGFIKKGTPFTVKPKQTISETPQKKSPKNQPNQNNSQPSQNAHTSQRNIGIPVKINPNTRDELFKKVKRANLYEDMQNVFATNDIKIDNREIKIGQFWDIVIEYKKHLTKYPLYQELSSTDPQKYIALQIQRLFYIGFCVYLNKNKTGAFVGRWSREETQRFLSSIKDDLNLNILDELSSTSVKHIDRSSLNQCFKEIAKKLLSLYGNECLSETQFLYHPAYSLGFHYAISLFGNEYFIPKLKPQNYGNYCLSENMCNAITHAFQNNNYAKEEFVISMNVAEHSKEIVSAIISYFSKKNSEFYSLCNAITSASFNAGIIAVKNRNSENLISHFTSEVFDLIGDFKEFIKRNPFLERYNSIDLICFVTNSSNVLNIKDEKERNIILKDVCQEIFLLGMSLMLQILDIKSENPQVKSKTFLTTEKKAVSSRRKQLQERLKAMANDETIITAERSEGAMCYSIRMPEEETYKCMHCGCTFKDIPDSSTVRYFKAIKDLGLDCKLEHWCSNCCHKTNLEISEYSKSRYVFFARLEPTEEYRISTVYSHELQTLYQFLKNENKYEGGFGRTNFVGESPETIVKLLGINYDGPKKD